MPAHRQFVVEIDPELVSGEPDELRWGVLSDGRHVQVYDRTLNFRLPPGEYDLIPGSFRKLAAVHPAIFGANDDDSPRPEIPGIPRLTVTPDGPDAFTIEEEAFTAAQTALDAIRCHPTLDGTINNAADASSVGADGESDDSDGNSQGTSPP